MYESFARRLCTSAQKTAGQLVYPRSSDEIDRLVELLVRLPSPYPSDLSGLISRHQPLAFAPPPVLWLTDGCRNVLLQMPVRFLGAQVPHRHSGYRPTRREERGHPRVPPVDI